jgi:hypothetical protein
MVAFIELKEGGEGEMQDARARIANELKGYLLAIEWASALASPD